MRKQTLSNMQLKSFGLEHIEISNNKSYDEKLEIVFKPKLDIDFSILKIDNEWRFKIPFHFTLKWAKECNYPYAHIKISMNSEFVFPPKTTEEEVKRFVPYVCLANLWGIARGIILQLTGVFPGGTILLPTINMVDAVTHAKRKIESKGKLSSPRK